MQFTAAITVEIMFTKSAREDNRFNYVPNQPVIVW